MQAAHAKNLCNLQYNPMYERALPIQVAHLEVEKLIALPLPFFPLAEVLSTAEYDKN